MKARVKEIEKIFQVMGVLSNTADGYALDEVDLYCDESDNLVVGVSEDYWEKLLHQYAGMAMQGILANIDLLMSLAKKKSDDYPAKYTVAEFAKDCAYALVEKLKEERK